MYSRNNEGKYTAAEAFIRTFRNEIYKYMTSISRNVYIDKLNEIIEKYNNTYHRTIKMKPLDVNPSINFDFNQENNKEDPKVKVGANVRIPKSKNIFGKSFVPNWFNEVFVIKKVKNTIPRAYVISNLNGEEIVQAF